uniref:Uncharacterized protein n=2 Tax=Magallana gigas TaxID=29159 RepID=A0A8W8MB04_MAGGI|nr:uncharacterized protein LOC105322318 [Crassostrea gigas]|eukprot:XP_011419259.1 PREDICTED: uncharacterized protein LOC105322318 [Crassostrea gigas]
MMDRHYREMSSFTIVKCIIVMVLTNFIQVSGSIDDSQKMFLKDYILRRFQTNEEDIPYEYSNDMKQKDQPALFVIEKVLRPREYDVTRQLDVAVDKRAFNIQGSILK